MAATATLSSAAYISRHSRVGTTGPAARPMGSSIMPMPTGSAGNISPSSATVGRALRPSRGAVTGPASASARA
jgi:hypothetical protein